MYECEGKAYLDPAAIEVVVIELVDGPLHVAPGGKLDHALVLPVLVGVGVGDVPCLSHQVLEVLEDETLLESASSRKYCSRHFTGGPKPRRENGK